MTKAPPELSSAVWHLRIAYHGGSYYGWQIQPGHRTVQEELLFRLRKLFRNDKLKIAATSRTDTGVHALDQNVSFSLPSTHSPTTSPDRLRRLLNRWLPPDIRVVAAGFQSPGFHARYSALAKAYVYVLENGDNHSPFSAPFAWQQNADLDLASMRIAASGLLGKHDFAGFSANPRRRLDTTVREIYRFDVFSEGRRVYLHVVGDGFLYKMVRSIAGYLVEIGQDCRWKPEDCRRILSEGERTAKVKTAPPQGLFLARVFFNPREWRNYQPVLPPFSG